MMLLSCRFLGVNSFWFHVSDGLSGEWAAKIWKWMPLPNSFTASSWGILFVMDLPPEINWILGSTAVYLWCYFISDPTGLETWTTAVPHSISLSSCLKSVAKNVPGIYYLFSWSSFSLLFSLCSWKLSVIVFWFLLLIADSLRLKKCSWKLCQKVRKEKDSKEEE